MRVATCPECGRDVGMVREFQSAMRGPGGLRLAPHGTIPPRSGGPRGPRCLGGGHRVDPDLVHETDRRKSSQR